MLVQKPIIYFLDQEKENKRTAKKVLGCFSPEIFFPKNINETEDLITTGEPALLIIDFDIYQAISQKGVDFSHTNILFLSSKKLSEIYLSLSEVPKFSHFLTKSPDGRLFASDLFTTVRKILKNDIFGVEKYLVWGGETESYIISSSSQRNHLIDIFENQAKKLGLRKPICNAISNLTDEFIMNAIFDAPLDENGEPKYFYRDRNEEFDLEEHELPTLTWGSDGQSLAVSISDPFGRITRDKVIEYLTRCFENQNEMVRDDQELPGAGVGLFLCFNMVQKFVINVDPGKRTEFIGIFDLKNSVEEWMKTNKSFHFFNTNWASNFFNKN